MILLNGDFYFVKAAVCFRDQATSRAICRRTAQLSKQSSNLVLRYSTIANQYRSRRSGSARKQAGVFNATVQPQTGTAVQQSPGPYASTPPHTYQLLTQDTFPPFTRPTAAAAVPATAASSKAGRLSAVCSGEAIQQQRQRV